MSDLKHSPPAATIALRIGWSYPPQSGVTSPFDVSNDGLGGLPAGSATGRCDFNGIALLGQRTTCTTVTSLMTYGRREPDRQAENNWENFTARSRRLRQRRGEGGRGPRPPRSASTGRRTS